MVACFFQFFLLHAQINLPAVASKNSKVFSKQIDKSALTAKEVSNYIVSNTKLSRKYYVSNIFDIEESDNPFALPIEGRKLKNQNRNNQKKGIQEVLNELFKNNTQSDSRYPQWLIFFLLAIFSYMSILLSIFPKSIKLFFHAFLSNAAARNIQREYQSLLKLENFACYLLFAAAMGAFCFMLPQALSEDSGFNSVGALLMSIAGIALVYFLKHMQLNLITFIFPFGQEVQFYNFAVANTNKVLAFLLPPILFILVYIPASIQLSSLYIILSFLGLIYLYRSISGIISAGSLILFYKFHFIVYLCAVEIAPILISLKLLSIL